MADERDVDDRTRAKAPPSVVDDLRRRIDVIDDQLMKLLNSRSACAVEIGRVKRHLGIAVYQPDREAWILERVIDESRRLERLAQEAEAREAGDAQAAPPPVREGD